MVNEKAILGCILGTAVGDALHKQRGDCPRLLATDLGPCLLASSLASHRVPGTCLRGRRAEFC